MSLEKRLADALAENPDRVLARVLLVAVVAAGIAAFAYLLKFGGLPFSGDPQHWGQLGDYIGGLLNPVFGFLSVFALLVTLVLQSRELRMSREALKVSQDELKMSREEQAKSAAALAEQNRVIHQQRVEQTFFSWLGTYRELVESAQDYEQLNDGVVTEFRGRGALQYWWRSYLSADILFWKVRGRVDSDSWYRCDQINNSKTALLQLLSQGYAGVLSGAALEKWEELYSAREYQLDSILRVLFNLLRWIDSQSPTRLSNAQKWQYASIVRAHLSWVELAYLFCNGHTPRGERFKALVNKYALFNNLPTHTDPILLILRECPPDGGRGYSPSAFSSEDAREEMGLPRSADETLTLAAMGTAKE
jgi:uncharacterized membrane protein